MSKRPPVRQRRASEANAAVERILGLTNQIGVDLRNAPTGMENAERMRRGIDPVWSMEVERAVGFEAASTLMDRAATYAVVDLWRKQGRLAYDLHPEMANSLYRADLKGKLPGSIFTRLRHISPMIPLPHSWPVKFSGGEEGRIRGYFITGRTGRAFCSTKDERSEGLCIVPWIDTDPEATTYHDTLTPVFPLPSFDREFTLDDLIEHSYEWHGVTKGSPQEERQSRRLIKQILPSAVTLLSYLSCKNADIQEPPPQPTRGRKGQAPSRDPFYVRVGWYVGPKLHAAQTRAAGRTKDGLSTPTGVEYGPQHRVGHTRTVHVGSGRKKSEVVWVDPYWTKLNMLAEGEEPVTQVVPVEAQQKDPASHRDVRLANLGNVKAKEIRDREAQRRREEDMEW